MATPADNQYAPPKSDVADVVGEEVLADRGARLGAYIIDTLAFGLPLAPAVWAAFPSIVRHAGAGSRNMVAVWGDIAASGITFYLGLLFVAAVALVNALLVHRNAQSIGKKLVGIKVARKDGSRAGLTRIFFVRNLLNGVISAGLAVVFPLLGNLYKLADTLFIFGSSRRCIHDYLADTIVIKA